VVKVTLERKKRYLVLHRNDGNFRRLCATLHIAPKTGYAWLKRHDQQGLEALLKDDLGGRPVKAVPNQVRQAVITVRKTHGWNEKKIQNELLLQGIETSFHSIRQVLAEAQVLGVAPPRKKRTFKDFERPRANHLWQADFSLLESGEEWLFALLDDYSRYLVGAEIFADPTQENALSVIGRAVQWHGSPFQLMTDHGAQFWNNKMDAPNSFGPSLKELGVEHILAGVKRPQTNGKIERWFGCYKAESPAFVGLSEYLYHYNFCRPQGGIYYRKPYQRYFAFRL
jgi:putative transposase